MRGRRVLIVGDPEIYEILCETATTMMLVNPAARLRRELEAIEARLAEVRAQLAAITGRP